MAKNFWESDKPAGDDGAFWASDRPAAQQDLPVGVAPSTAGAGRGSTGPGDYARPAPAPVAAPVPAEPTTDPMGSGDFAAAVANPGERRVSVLQDRPMHAPDPARRLSMGAGPISQETAARAERLVDGQDPGAANRPVVERAARGLQAQVDAGTRNTFGDLVERANDPTTQRLARDQTAEQFRSIGEWALDSSTALASGAVSLAQMVPNIVAPDSALSASLAKAQQGLQDMESAPMQARRQQLAERVKSEDGFLNQYVATVSELVTNPSVAIQESLRQAAMFAGVLGAAKLGGAAAGGAVGAAERVSPTLALGEAISGGAIRTAAQAGGATAGGVAASSTMAAGDAAGATYEKLMATDDATWKSSPDFQELVAKGVPPEQAKQEIAVTKARLAALMAAPLGVLGFMGAEASFAGRAGAGAGRPMRTLATEMVTEPAEEALTTIAGNTAVQTVNPNQQITEGAGEAAGMATVTSAPFGGAAAINEMRTRPPVDRSEQIKALRAAGDKIAADLLQRRQDRELAAFTTEREAEALQPFGPAVQQRYRESRAAGAMPGDAVTQVATRTTFEEAAQAAGLSEKAREAALAKAASMPPDEAPGFLQRALQVFTSKGLAQPIEGAEALATAIESRRDELLDTVLAADIRPTMAAIEELENAPGAAANPTPVAETPASVSPEPESVADNDILVAPETDAVHQAATSPLNDLPEPTQAQKEAGNYKLGRVRIGGMDIAVENPQGSVRRGTAPDGTPWETPMRDHYGYFNGTTAADGDKLDVFIKPGTAPDFDGTVFVVDQVDPGTGKFDEAKVIFGATDQADAEAIYSRNYSADWQGLGAITALPMPAFKAWATSKQTRKPLGVLPTPTNAEVAPSPAADREAAPDQTPPAAGGDAAAPANGVSAEGAAAALEANGVGEAPVVAAPPAPAAPSVSTTLRKDGTLAVKGDAAEIRQRLAKAGITNVLAMRGGVLVGKSSATKAQALLGDVVAPEPERPSSPAPKRPEAIQDLGEKIGGARKDTAESKGAKRSSPKSKDERPAWARRFQISQIADVSGVSDGGRWVIRDLRNVDWRKQPRQVGDTFATRAEAEAAVPIAAVGLKHRVVSSGGKYEIWRDISDRKRVKVVAQQFESREEALRHMAENAEEIVETNTTFGEADLPVPENKARVGVKRREGDVQGQDFMTAFGFRGVEFGNWNNQDERQQLMNEAYDGLLDLAEVLDVPARAIGLNGDLALAFGARGQGLSGARAHYEPAKVVMNLTKMNGAGALAHEWFHALDHYFARQDGKSSSSWQVDADGTRSLKVSDNFEHEAASAGFLRTGSGVRPEVREAYTRLMETMFRKAEKYVEDTARADRFVADTREEVRKNLAALRRELAAQKDAAYYKRHNKPASTEQLAEFDGVAELIVEGIALATEWRTIEKGAGKLSGYRWTNDHLEKIGEIFKAVRGRSGFSKDNHGPIDRLRSSMNLYASRLKMLADAQASTAKTKQVPTSFAMDAKSLDQGRGTAYWTTPHEMAARAFQGFLEDRITERGGRSPFLNYGPENAVIITPWGFSRPYPAGEERQALNRAFQKLLDIIETKETDTGVALFARVLDEDLFRRMTTPMQRGMPVGEVEKAIAPVLDRWKNGPTVKVVATTADLPVTAPHDVAGFYTDGRAYLVATNIRDSESALRFLGHEAIAHHGLREMLGDAGFRQFTNQVQLALKTGNKALAAIQSEVRAAYVDADGKFNLSPYQESDEIAAKVVEQAIDADGKFRPGFGFVKAVYAKIAEFLRGLGLTVRFTHAELQGMLINAQRRLEAGKRTGGARTALEPVWARSEAPQISAAIVGSNLGAGTSHPKYSAAKGGDVEAAVEVARALVTDDLVAQVRKVIGDSKPTVVPVASIEAAGRNKIPLAAAVMLADRLGLATSGDIMQANSKGVLLTNAAAREYLAAVTPARKMVLDALAKRVDAITAGTRRLLVDEGLEKAETIAAWEEAYKNYVPMFRDEAEEGRPHPTGSGMSVRGSASKRATGSTKEVTNILAHVLMQREAAITRAEKNRVAVALYGMALTNPNPDFWATIHPGMRPEAIGRELQRMGVDPTVAEAGMQGVPTIRTVDPVLNRVVDRPNPIYKSLPGAIVLKVNGDDRVLMINAQDPRGMRMAENLKNLDGLTRLDIASSTVGKTTRWLASVNTQYNPAFGLVNLTRDTLGGAINLSSTRLRGKTAKVLAMTPGAIRGIALELAGRSSGEWGKLWRQFQADGGQTGYREMFKDANDRTARLQAELKSLEKAGKLTTQKVAGKLLGALDVFNTSLENAVRLAAYREGLQEGMSRAEAARLGRELTVDFNRKGRTGRELSPLYAFFNAAVQGSARTLETLAGPAGAKIIAGGLSLGVLQAVMLLLAGYDDDEIPEFVKSRALIVPLGKDDEGKKQFFTIPYPLGLHVLPNTGRVLAELTLSGGDKAKDRAFDAVGEIAGAFNPFGGGNIFTGDGFLRTIAPSVVDPVIETLSNKNFAGAPIEREAQGENDPRPGFQRVREATLRTATGQTYTDIARIINTMTGGNAYEKGAVSPSPEMVRYWAQVVGGGLLREIEKTVNTSIDAAKGQPVKTSGVPVLGRFYEEVDDANVQRSRYFDNLREIETLERKIRAADKAGDVDAATRMEADGTVVDASRAARRAKKEITALNREAMETIGDGPALRELDAERTEVMRELNTEVDEIRQEKRGPMPGERLRQAAQL